MNHSSEDRADYIAGLRAIADALADNPEIPLPYHGRIGEFSWVTSHAEDPKAATAAIVRHFGGGSSIMLFTTAIRG